MPTRIRNTDILFNDGTTQSTAAIVTTTAVLNATSAASVGAVGTYAFLSITDATTQPGIGGTVAGSTLRYSSADAASTTAPSGTWRQMGWNLGQAGYSYPNAARVSVWLRIS